GASQDAPGRQAGAGGRTRGPGRPARAPVAVARALAPDGADGSGRQALRTHVRLSQPEGCRRVPQGGVRAPVPDGPPCTRVAPWRVRTAPAARVPRPAGWRAAGYRGPASA